MESHRQFVDLKDYRPVLEDMASPENTGIDFVLDHGVRVQKNRLHHILDNINTILGAAGGNKVQVDFSLRGQNTLGYVSINDHSTINISPDILEGSKSDARHVTTHERRHNSNQIHELALDPNKFSNDHLEALEETTSPLVTKILSESAGVSMMEGFNEYGTILEAGYMEGIYPDEVEAAKELQVVAYQYTGESLISLFDSGKSNEIELVLKKIADRLLLHQALKAAVDEDAIDDKSMIYQELKHQLDLGALDHHFIHDFKDACFVIEENKRQIAYGQLREQGIEMMIAGIPFTEINRHTERNHL